MRLIRDAWIVSADVSRDASAVFVTVDADALLRLRQRLWPTLMIAGLHDVRVSSGKLVQLSGCAFRERYALWSWMSDTAGVYGLIPDEIVPTDEAVVPARVTFYRYGITVEFTAGEGSDSVYMETATLGWVDIEAAASDRGA